jgi:hypothetical protein
MKLVRREVRSDNYPIGLIADNIGGGLDMAYAIRIIGVSDEFRIYSGVVVESSNVKRRRIGEKGSWYASSFRVRK